MLRQHYQKKNLPDTPGVYFFLGKNRKILYIGRATSLKERVRSYFSADLFDTRGPQIIEMVSKASQLDFKKTDSVLEAIILEADLIKKFQPYYNTREKDDKSFNCVVVTKEDFPQILVVRKKDIDPASVSVWYGPFPSGGQLRDALKIVRRIFTFRDAKCFPNQGRPCFNRQIGLCPGVCTGEISKADYGKIITNIKLFFTGKKNQILKKLEREMALAAKKLQFEHAHEIKKTVFALRHIQDVSLIKTSSKNLDTQSFVRIEAYDVAHISGTDVVGVMVVVENGEPKKQDYRKFKIRGGFGNNDVASLKEVLERRLNHPEWPLPTLFVADGGVAQKSVIEGVLRTRNLSKDVVAVTKNEKHRPEKILGDPVLIKAHEKSILLANAEAHRFTLAFHRKRRTSSWK
ncbi:MAG: GIY-YIG nuclease family protein [Patescibacteria group bacterium]